MSTDFTLESVQTPDQFVEGQCFPSLFETKNVEDALRFRPADNDLVLATYPKSGTTWTQYIVCNLLNYDEFKGDFSETKKACPFIEAFGIEGLQPGSFYKTHLPFHKDTFNPKAKYILVVRNPRDVAVSYYHHYTIIPPGIVGMPKDFNWFPKFAELFVDGKVWYGDYFEHVLSWLNGTREHGNPDNVLWLIYEKMKADPEGELKRIAKFIGGKAEELVQNQEAVKNILNRTSLSTMKKDVNTSLVEVVKKMANTDDVGETVNFIRKGQVGDYVNFFTPAISDRFDKWIAADSKNDEVMKLFEF